MIAGNVRLLPFALASATLHLLVLAPSGDGLRIATRPGDRPSTVAVRLVPAGPAASASESASAVARAAPVEEQPTRAEREPAKSTETKADSAGTSEPSPANTDESATASRQTARKATRTSDASRSSADDPSAPDPERQPASENSRVAEHALDGTDVKRARPHPTQPAGAGGRADHAQSARNARAVIVTELSRYFSYPRLARLRGWEGRVLIGCTIQPNGDITDIHVVESSGRAMLDEAAMDALRQVERLPELERKATEGPLDLELPVTYRLQAA